MGKRKNQMNCRKEKNIFFHAFAVMALALCFVFGVKANISKVSAADYDKLKKEIITAYQNYQTSISVKEYKIYNDSATSKQISRMFEEIMNETPYLFYNGREFSKSVIADTNQIVTLHLEYLSVYKKNGKVDVNKIKQTRKKLDTAIAAAGKYVKKNMTDAEKAMVLHDYLIRKVAYYNQNAETECLSEVGAFLKKKANCQGYTMAYKILLEKAGIASKCVISETMDHMWNLVQIDNKWYHVDLVWDDPISVQDKKNRDGIVLHENFLLSDTAMRKNGHTGFAATAATSRHYDNKYWKKCTTSFWYQDNAFLYGTSKGIYQRKTLGSKPKCIYKANVSCLIRGDKKQYYFVRDKKSIWKYDVAKAKWSKLLTSKHSIIQLTYTSKKLQYKIYKNGKLFQKVKKM